MPPFFNRECKDIPPCSDEIPGATPETFYRPTTGAEDESTDYLSLIKDSDLARFRDIVEELRAEESVGLAAASVAARELSALADRVARNPRQEDRR